MAKLRSHNEYFRTVAPNRKSCKTCKHHFVDSQEQWSWGNYIVGKWYTVAWFCEACFPTVVYGQLYDHTASCGCTVNLIAYSGGELPDWLCI